MHEVRVGIGEVKVAQGDIILSAYGVGSCVVIVLFDTAKRLCGFAHCLLPEGDATSTKYPRGAIGELLRQMIAKGAVHADIVAKVIGGATMFEGFAKHQIGKRNVLEARKECDRINIPIIAEDVFGNWGRTISCNAQTGEVIVRSFKHGSKVL
ncbi:chemotaxis protein CheD [candidate division WOR-3 bacterium]|nr:chemotaxis protein CheD [candidate division WOR-3 bacterium]